MGPGLAFVVPQMMWSDSAPGLDLSLKRAFGRVYMSLAVRDVTHFTNVRRMIYD